MFLSRGQKVGDCPDRFEGKQVMSIQNNGASTKFANSGGLVGKRILVAEDEGLIAMDIEMAFQDSLAEVIGPLPTLAAVLRAVEHEDIDCAVLDVRLADAEVYPAARKLRERGTPIVFHSGHASSSRLMQDYPDAVVCSKPCGSDEIVRRTARLL